MLHVVCRANSPVIILYCLNDDAFRVLLWRANVWRCILVRSSGYSGCCHCHTVKQFRTNFTHCFMHSSHDSCYSLSQSANIYLLWCFAYFLHIFVITLHVSLVYPNSIYFFLHKCDFVN